MADIPSDFIDVDFRKFDQFVAGDSGVGFSREYNQFELLYRDVVLTRAEMIAEIEKLEAEKTGAEYLVKEIKDQGRLGSCVGNMGANGLQILQAQQVGLEKTVILAAESIYDNIGSSPNSGAMVSDCLDFVAKHGAVPQANAENVAQFGIDVCTPPRQWQACGPVSRWSAERKAAAAQFRLAEWTIFRTWDGIISALLRGWVVGVGRSGHSILYVRPAVKSGRIGAVYANSWTPDWGFPMGKLPGGFGFDSESVVDSIGWAIGFRSLVAR